MNVHTHTHIYQMDHTIIQIHIHIQESYINTYHKEQMDGERITKNTHPSITWIIQSCQ